MHTGDQRQLEHGRRQPLGTCGVFSQHFFFSLLTTAHFFEQPEFKDMISLQQFVTRYNKVRSPTKYKHAQDLMSDGSHSISNVCRLH